MLRGVASVFVGYIKLAPPRFLTEEEDDALLLDARIQGRCSCSNHKETAVGLVKCPLLIPIDSDI